MMASRLRLSGFLCNFIIEIRLIYDNIEEVLMDLQEDFPKRAIFSPEAMQEAVSLKVEWLR